MDTNYTWTCDVESSWGGRTSDNLGITKGLPMILEVFRAYNVKALFFVSSEIALDNRGMIQRIIDHGHEIGSHGHFHIKYKDDFRAEQDRQISNRLLSIFSTKDLKYRAPRFYYQIPDSIYSYRNNHLSLLKYTWFGGRISRETIFYIHPFDVVDGIGAPNLFCRLLYSRPRYVYENFIKLVSLYPGRCKIK